MPQNTRALTRAARERCQYTGETYTQARVAVLETQTLDEKEQQAHAFAAAVRIRMAHTGEDEPTARTSVTEIQELVDSYGGEYTFAQAQAAYDDPRNQIMCHTCGWTNGMVCPECPGCGCYNGQCSGWRHDEFMSDDERRERDECPDCGGNINNHYECTCHED